MDPIWKQLPADLTDKICNSLTKCRKIPKELRDEIVLYHMYREFRKKYTLGLAIQTILFVMSGENPMYMRLQTRGTEELALNLWFNLTDSERLLVCSEYTLLP